MDGRSPSPAGDALDARDGSERARDGSRRKRREREANRRDEDDDCGRGRSAVALASEREVTSRRVRSLLGVAVLVGVLATTPLASAGSSSSLHPAIADIAVSMTDEPDPVAAGNQLTFRITVENHGPDDAEAVRLLDLLPAGTVLVSASASAGWCPNEPAVTCELGWMGPGGSASVTIVVRPTIAGELENIATMQSTERDPFPENDSAITTTVVTASTSPVPPNPSPPAPPPPPPSSPPPPRPPAPPQTPARDTTPPRVKALPSRGRRGKTMKIRYRVSDDSGMSKERVTVYRSRQLLATIGSPLDRAEAGTLYYYVKWRVPGALRKGTLRACVRATDPAGNRSKTSCAVLRVT